jgi:hypothetical protein
VGETGKGNKGLECNVCVSFSLLLLFCFVLFCFLSMRWLLFLRMDEVVGVGVGRRGDKLVLL